MSGVKNMLAGVEGQDLSALRPRAEYVWLGLDSTDIRCKTKVLDSIPTSVDDLPVWNYDGSSTGQAPGHDSEVHIKPRAIFQDPFRRGAHNILVLCDTYKPNGEPLPSNGRAPAAALFNKAPAEEPWFGIEQEYTLFKDGTPLGWPRSSARSFGAKPNPIVQFGYPGPQGPYYCSAGADVAFGREIAEAHLEACIYAGVRIAGVNAEVMCGQWEYQVGPCTGIDAGDHVTMSRYIMNRVGELYDVVVSFEPKPIPGDWNGAGCHTNYSTAAMRAAGGINAINAAVEKLGKKHAEHMQAYGEDNDKRMTGAHETASYNTFSSGVGNRGASIRIPTQTAAAGCGYLEDRRPAANMDPYKVTSLLFETTVL